MAVYSYKTGTISPQIISFQTIEISNFSSSVLSEIISQNNIFKLNSKTTFSEETLSFSYNESSTLYTLFEDYGSIFDDIAPTIEDYQNSSIQEYADIEIDDLLSPGSSIEDYGSISSTATIFEKYGSIFDDTTPANGRVGKIISTSKHSISRAFEVKGVSFLFQGKSDVYINSSYIGYGILSYSNGISSEKNTESYVGTGRAFGFGSKAERVVASYNNSSVISYESLNYGSVIDGIEGTIGEYSNELISTYANTEIGVLLSIGSSIDDYGSIIDQFSGQQTDNYGLITGSGLRPFGLTRFSSATIEKNTEDYVGSGELFNFGTAKIFVLPIHYGKGILKIRGAYSDLKNTESYVGTGSLFGFSSAAEAFGPKPPVSGLFRVSGAAVEKNTEDYVGSGKLFNFGNAEEFVTPSYVGSGSFSIRGEYSDLNNTESYVGTGRAFGFGSKAERTTASYNESSIVNYESSDYGSIIDGIDGTIGDYANTSISTYANTEIGDLLIPGSSIDDYGSIIDDPNLPEEREDYGLITGRGLRPFGLTRFFSAVIEKNTEDYVGSGTLFAFISKTESKTYIPSSTGLFKFGGSVAENNTESYVGEGRAFGFGSKAERTAVSYNQSSVIEYSGLDYGSIVDGIEGTIGEYSNALISTYANTEIGDLLTLGSSVDDYGFIVDGEFSGQQTDNYGLITGSGLRPFGLTSFSGHLVEKNTESYVGTGSLFGFSSAAEAFGPKPPVSGLFRISGAATQSITPATEIGSGSIFTFVSKTETFGANPPENIQLFRFSGHLVEKNTESYFGTGSLFGFSSTTEAFGPKPPVSGLFRISGAATQSITPTTEIGSGSVKVFQASQILDADDKSRLVAAYERVTFEEVAEPEAIRLRGRVGIYFQFRESGSGTLKVRGRAVIKLKPIHIGSGCYFIRGAATQSITPATEIGSGSIFTFVSKTETFGANPPENTALFKFNNSAVIRNTESYVGIGLERIDVKSLIIIKLRYPGSGSVNVSGDKLERRNYSHTGSGKLFGFGSASEYLTNAYKLDTFVIRIRGSAQDSHSESYVGSGSVFAFVSGVESKGANPPENIALFKFSGSGRGRTQPVYYGEGSIKVSEGSGRPDKNNKTFIVSSDESGTFRTTEKPVQFKFFGSAVSSRPTVYKGRGSIFGFGGTADSVSFSPDDTKELFKISGSASEKNTESYVGTGTIFSITGSSYSRSSRPKEITSLFNINGSASEAFAEANYDGLGSLFANIQSKSRTSFSPKSTTTLFQFVGSSKERNTEAYNGSGSIGVFISTGRSVFYDYKVSQKAFRIFGNTFESFGKSNYNGSSYSIITGLSENQKRNYIPPKRTRIFII